MSHSPPSPAAGRVDFAAAIAELGGMRDLYAEAAALFLDDAPRQQGALHQAIAAADWATARRVAHTLKAMAAALGAHTLCDLALSVEHQCHAGLSADHSALDVELHAVCHEVRCYLTQSVQ